MKTVMEYVEGNSFFHQLHPLTKLSWAVVTCIACFLCSNLYILAGIVLLNIGIALVGKVFKEATGIFKMFFVIGLFLFLFQALFIPEGQVIFSPIKGIKITDVGISSGLLLALRMSGALLPLSLMIILTPISDLSAEMVEKLHIPYKYTFVLTTALRFIPTFSTEMDQIIQAQVCRGCDLDSKNMFKKIKMIIPMSIPLLVSSVRKIEKQAIALEIRGFNTPNRSRYKVIKLSYRDFLIVLYLVLLIAFILIMK